MPLKDKFRIRIAAAASLMESVIAVVVLIAIVVTGVRVVGEITSLWTSEDASLSFTTFLGHAFNLIIGVEFIKMLAKHTPGSAIEVLLFTIARGMVVEHTTQIQNLIGIVTIALIFVVRKYLFVPSFGEHPSVFSAYGAAEHPEHAPDRDEAAV